MSAAPLKVLVIDDEPPIRKLLRMGLETQGYQTIDAPNGKVALDRMAEEPDLVILDLGLPDMQGLELLRRIREQREDLPIVVLSSRGDEVDQGRGARSRRRRLRDQAVRHGGALGPHPRGAPPSAARRKANGRSSNWAILSVDLVRRIVKLRDVEVKLSPKEYELLRVLVQHAGKVLTHKFLLNELWSVPIDAQYLRVYVRQLRHKIEPNPERPQYILTETGIGYRLRAPD